MDIKFYLTIVIALLNIFLGLFILRKNPKNPSNYNYAGLCISAGLWAISIALIFVAKDVYTFELLIKVNYFFGILAPLFYVVFAYNFPYRKKLYPKMTPYLIYGIPVIQIILVLSNVLKMEIVVDNGNMIFSSVIFNDFLIFTVYFFAYVILGFFILLNKYFC